MMVLCIHFCRVNSFVFVSYLSCRFRCWPVIQDGWPRHYLLLGQTKHCHATITTRCSETRDISHKTSLIFNNNTNDNNINNNDNTNNDNNNTSNTNKGNNNDNIHNTNNSY